MPVPEPAPAPVPGPGDDDDNSGAASCGDCDFTVTLHLKDTTTQSAVSNRYLLKDAKDHESVKPHWQSTDKQYFESLETAQFSVDPLQNGAHLYINDTHGESNCMAVFNRNRDPYYATLGGASSTSTTYPLLSWQTTSLAKAPIHLTGIPFQTKAGEKCRDMGPHANLNADRALAIWISGASDMTDVDCSFVEDLKYGDQRTVGNKCYIQRPKANWTFIPSSGNSVAYVEYKGSLVDTIARLEADTTRTQLKIHIKDNVTLSRGLSSAYVNMAVQDGYEQECLAAVKAINTQGLNKVKSSILDACEFMSSPVVAYSKLTTKKIIVTGHGRISGQTMLNEYGATKKDNNNFNYFEQAQWQIDVQLLGLSSAHASIPAIDVSNITIAWPTYRGIGAVTLNANVNGVGFPPDDNYPKGNNFPVKMFDVKQAGGWLDQADGPEVMGDSSEISFSYIHANDDAVKISAQNVSYLNSTILKGGAGGAVAIGSYGYNRAVNGSRVEGVYIHRITQKKVSDKCESESINFNCAIAVIYAPACPIALQSNASSQTAGTSDVAVDNVYLPELGTNAGPNSIGRLFGLGVSDKLFCPHDGDGWASSYTYGDFKFTNFSIYTNPADVSFIFGDTGTSKSTINWKKITFGSSPKNCDTGGVRIFPTDDPKQWYCPCGPQKVADGQYCPTTNPPGGGVKNIYYYKTDGLDVIYPYDKTTSDSDSDAG